MKVARSTSHRCERALTEPPLPLYSDVLDVAVLWNAKAGCTFAVKWLFFQEGVLDEALAYSPWPHHYRQFVYCARPRYTRRLKHIPALGERAIKFVRDPFDRAVGGYLSYCRQATGWSGRQHDAVREAIGKHVDRPVRDGARFSFREFVGFLGSLDLDRADIHLRRQTHRCERLECLPDLSVVRVEDAVSTLGALEDQLRLRHSDPAQLRHSAHDTKRTRIDTFVGDHPFGDLADEVVPTSAAFYDRTLRTEVARLYDEDLQRYGYTGEA